MKRILVFIACLLAVSSGTLAQETVRQWASSAVASSEYGSDRWSAAQATGRPDTTGCGDFTTAWASATSTGEDTLMLAYVQPVIPTQINIYQTYNPGSIIRVELGNSQTKALFSINKSNDKPGNTSCPGVFTLNVTGVTEPIDTVVIHLDQRIGGNWNEIDAVELVGIPSGSPSTNTEVSGPAAGISVQCPEGYRFDNGSEIIVNMRSGFTYTATAIGINGFDPIIAVTDYSTTLCNDDDVAASSYVANLPTTGNVSASTFSAQMPFSYNGSSAFGDVSIIVGSVNNTPGEFVLVIEGLAVTSADGSGEGAGDPFSVHLTPNMQASGVPVTAYMISVTTGLDPFLYVVNEEKKAIIMDNGSFLACDDSGTQSCYGVSERLGRAYISRTNGRTLAGGDLDAMMSLTWPELGVTPGNEAYVNWLMSSASQRTYGDYVAVFHIGTANEFSS